MFNSKQFELLFSKLHEMFPDPKTELNYKTPFQLVVAVILSAQTTDKQVNKTTQYFFDRIKTPQDLIDFGHEDFIQAVKTVNLYRSKANNIWKLANITTSKEYLERKKELCNSLKAKKILKDFGFIIPDSIEKLVELPGIGEKTAKVVAHVLFDHKVIAVDTHVHRVTNRLGIVKTSTPLQTSKILEGIIPEKYLEDAHHLFILFGRYHCTARNPKCGTCPFQKICNYYQTVVVKGEIQKKSIKKSS